MASGTKKRFLKLICTSVPPMKKAAALLTAQVTIVHADGVRQARGRFAFADQRLQRRPGETLAEGHGGGGGDLPAGGAELRAGGQSQPSSPVTPSFSAEK